MAEKLWWVTILFLGCSPKATEPTFGAISPEVTTVAYDRAQWGSWYDADKDCQDTRQEVLTAESEIPVVFTDAKQCRVATGRWTCPYTGLVFTDPLKLDIDHMVPLKEAHESGGAVWPTEKKRLYFNNLDNPGHLVAASLTANRSKGDRAPEEWLPPKIEARCAYLRSWVQVKKLWALDTDTVELETLVSLLVEHCR
jgi:hypothetical protein